MSTLPATLNPTAERLADGTIVIDQPDGIAWFILLQTAGGLSLEISLGSGGRMLAQARALGLTESRKRQQALIDTLNYMMSARAGWVPPARWVKSAGAEIVAAPRDAEQPEG